LTALLIALVVIPGTVGDLLNSAGMKRHGEIMDWSPRSLVRLCFDLLRNFYVMAGMPAMAVSFFALMALLSTTRVSFAIPMAASSYIVETALAHYLLKEHVNWERWLGTCLVAIGVIMLSL
jgi:drug/metabolite transporter (DMT)-like permease